MVGEAGLAPTKPPAIDLQSIVIATIRLSHMAGSVGFEPTGISPQLISSQCRYDRFGNCPSTL